MKSPIIITGAPRSGTSMVAGIVERLGAFGGVTQGKGPAAPRGMYENLAIRRNVEKPFLQYVGADPMCQHPLPEWDDAFFRAVDRLAGSMGATIYAIMLSEGRGWSMANTPWYVKSPKACILWPLWHAMFPEARWIFVERDPRQIAESCQRTQFMRAHKTVDGWLGYVAAHLAARDAMRAAGLAMRSINSEDIIAGDYACLEAALEWAGLTFDAEVARSFCDPKLYHQTGVAA